jgi:hypothetical protein
MLQASVVAGPPDGATGIVVDGSALEIDRARFPRVYDEGDNMIYPPDKLCADPNYQGFEGYKRCVDDAVKDAKRVGGKPWVITPLRLKGNDPIHGSVVVNAEDAVALRRLNVERGLLDRDRVAFVLGMAVAEAEPAGEAVKAKPEAPVKIKFSKALADSCADNASLLSVTTADGTIVGGKVRYDADSKTLVFSPSSPWAPGTKYTVRVSHLIESDLGGVMDADYVFSFQVAAGESHAASSDRPGGAADGGARPAASG